MYLQNTEVCLIFANIFLHVFVTIFANFCEHNLTFHGTCMASYEYYTCI